MTGANTKFKSFDVFYESLELPFHDIEYILMYVVKKTSILVRSVLVQLTEQNLYDFPTNI